MMSNAREKALARLLITSLAIDLSLVVLLTAALPQLLTGNFQSFLKEIPGHDAIPLLEIVSLGATTFVYFFISEFFLGGWTIGRFATGLTLFDVQRASRPHSGQIRRRFFDQVQSLGLRSLTPNAVARYNRKPDCCIRSDWLGNVEPGVAKLSLPPNRKVRINANAGTIGRLEVVEGANKGSSVLVRDSQSFKNKSPFKIGRDAKIVDLALSGDPQVSAIHCRLGLSGGKFIIMDGGSAKKPSRSGTTVNGQRLLSGQSKSLSPGDEIHIGKSRIRFS